MNDFPAPLPALERDRVLVSIVIPVFNEERTIASVLEKLDTLDFLKEIIIVDDGSTDATVEILESLSGRAGLRLFRLEENRGKGAALRRGFAEAKGAIVIVQDADSEYDPGDIPALLEPILSGDADIVYGSRFIGIDRPPERALRFNWLGNKAITFACNTIGGSKLTDVETGHKAFRADVLTVLDLHENRFGIEVEMTMKSARLGCRVREVSVSYRPRSHAEGKKLGWRDAISALRCVVRYGFFKSAP